MEKLEHGGIWSDLGITNFLEGDLFSWYLAAWDERMAGVVRDISRILDDYDPSTLSVEPAESRDLLKHLYQQLFPKSVRHDLGEYYTPDWLAEHVLNQIEYDGNPDRRLLDPACGSGTFLVMAINRAKAWFDENRDQCGFSEKHLLQKILQNIIGFDLNPLAVMAARVNYLLAVRDLLREAGAVELPVYLCDSVLTPAEYGTLFERGQRLKTSVGEFVIPSKIAESQKALGKYAETLEHCVRDGYSPEEFVERCRQDGLPVEEREVHTTLYKNIRALDKKNQNGIWARILKNAFAPLFVGKVHYVAGNPPWVNWENLPEGYRNDLKPLWQRYGLFTLSGSAGRLGGGKKDLSMLFVYAAVDRFLEDGGRLGFVITQTVFKTVGAGDGFRQLQFDDGKRFIRLKPLSVDDLSRIKVFEGATNRTAVFACERQTQKFDYPVAYNLWKGPSRINQDESLESVKTFTQRLPMQAIPITKGKRGSPWLTVPKEALPGTLKAVGNSSYQAHEGVNSGGLNGCFWLRVLDSLENGNVLIENLHDIFKKKVEQVQTVIEPDLVFPLICGRDVDRWHAGPSVHFLLSQNPKTKRGIPEPEMKRKYPKTFTYLKKFEKPLRKRASSSIKRLMENGPFYSIFSVGPYTMAPSKVMWPELGNTVHAGVWESSDGEKDRLALPEHTVVYISCRDSEEAHYACAVLNSAPAQAVIRGYVALHPSPHITEHVGIPRFSVTQDLHKRLAGYSIGCHSALAEQQHDRVKELESKIDKAAAELWSITASELSAIQRALQEM